jgi:hypothetical protein
VKRIFNNAVVVKMERQDFTNRDTDEIFTVPQGSAALTVAQETRNKKTMFNCTHTHGLVLVLSNSVVSALILIGRTSG